MKKGKFEDCHSNFAKLETASIIFAKYNLRSFAFKPNAMMESMDKELRPSRLSEQLNKHYAAIAIPQGLYCLLLRLTDEYSSKAFAREQLPPPELVPCLMDNSYCYFVLASDNILAASVVIRSTVRSSLKPEKIVSLVITDKKWHLVMNLSAAHPVKPAFRAFS